MKKKFAPVVRLGILGVKLNGCLTVLDCRVKLLQLHQSKSSVHIRNAGTIVHIHQTRESVHQCHAREQPVLVKIHQHAPVGKKNGTIGIRCNGVGVRRHSFAVSLGADMCVALRLTKAPAYTTRRRNILRTKAPPRAKSHATSHNASYLVFIRFSQIDGWGRSRRKCGGRCSIGRGKTGAIRCGFRTG